MMLLSKKKKFSNPTKPIKLTAKSNTAICRKTNPKQYALVLITRKSISIVGDKFGRKPSRSNCAHPNGKISNKDDELFVRLGRKY